MLDRFNYRSLVWVHTCVLYCFFLFLSFLWQAPFILEKLFFQKLFIKLMNMGMCKYKMKIRMVFHYYGNHWFIIRDKKNGGKGEGVHSEAHMHNHKDDCS